METLIYFAIWASLAYLTIRLVSGARVIGQSQAQASGVAGTDGHSNIRWTAPEKDTDPVCGKLVRTERAKPSVHDGHVYYFCSRDCREIFEAAPELYPDGGDHNQELEYSHA